MSEIKPLTIAQERLLREITTNPGMGLRWTDKTVACRLANRIPSLIRIDLSDFGGNTFGYPTEAGLAWIAAHPDPRP